MFVSGRDWREFVKNVCYGAPAIGSSRSHYDVDFVIVPSSANHADVKQLFAPIPTTKNHIMGKSQKSSEYLANNLLGLYS